MGCKCVRYPQVMICPRLFHTGTWTQLTFVNLCNAGSIKRASKPHVGTQRDQFVHMYLRFGEQARARFHVVLHICTHRKVFESVNYQIQSWT